VFGKIVLLDGLQAELVFELAGQCIKVPFKVACPKEENPSNPHLIEKNGHAVKTKAKSQQFHCISCGRYFYAQTSQFFSQFETQIKRRLKKTLMDGDLKSIDIAKLCNWSVSSAGRVIDKVLSIIEAQAPAYRQSRGKMHAKIVFVDETFLKIKKKTWYLIMAVSDSGQILAAELKEHRDQDSIIRMVHEIEAQLNYPIEVLATDGFSTYKGVALALHHDLIHVRHIHQPPYGRIEVDTITLQETPEEVEVMTIATINDIFQVGGVFQARVQKRRVKVLNHPPLKRGRKAGGKNRPNGVINAEKIRKETNPKKRGRPKKNLGGTVFLFKLDKEKGCVQPWCEGAQDAANILTSLYHVFGQKCITTNLIEKEFSAFKILICFRGRRSLERWKRLLQGYCWIRNNPFLLNDVLPLVTLSGTAVRNALIYQFSADVIG